MKLATSLLSRFPAFFFLGSATLSLPTPLRAAEEIAPTSSSPRDETAAIEFFEKKIRPIFTSHCYQCHSADTKPAGGLRVDDRNGLLMGGDEGPAVVAGNPEKSLILERIHLTDPKRKMPKEGDPLTEAEIADLTTWIKDGAAWPHERVPASLGKSPEQYAELKAKHWAWQPLSTPPVPAVANASWPKTGLDSFVLAKLEQKNLPPVAEADRPTLIRRLSYDLTGLPPSPADIEAFVSDTSPDALPRLVDKLLASPQFGERWGRHWLDVARYGESTGPSRNIPYPHAWKYRDYVLDAVNRDVPFDRFLQEQIAGDLLPADSPDEKNRLLTATGFLALGVKDVNQRFKTRFLMDNVDEQIDVVSRSFLGLTVSCARCHDHKFDPIPTTDYYSLAGIFTSTENAAGVRNKMGGGGMAYYDPANLLTLTSTGQNAPVAASEEEVTKLQAKVDEAKKKWDGIRGTPEGLAKQPNGQPVQRPFRLRFEQLQADLAALKDPSGQALNVHGVREGKTIADTEVRIRGEAERLGPVVPRGFLTTFSVPDAPASIPSNESGRLELAKWLSSPKNPLTPRIIVNRVWQHLFGEGIVKTVDNFGVTGDTPSHPELLDYLANSFIQNGWSTKKLIREIVLSRSYQLGTDAPASHVETDPGNRLVWRHSPRRLDAEELRDSILAASGKLEIKPPVASPAQNLKMREMNDTGAEARTINEQADRSVHRSVYLPLLRGVTPKTLEAFDPVSQSLVTGQREATTVPTQALFLLNSGFVRQQSLALAEQAIAQPDQDDAARIRRLYLLILGRTPAEQEVTRAREFVAEYAANLQQQSAPAPEPALAIADVPAAQAASEDSVNANGTSTGNGTIVVDPTESTAPVDTQAAAPAATGATAATAAVVANPDDVPREAIGPAIDNIKPKTERDAAWMSLVQALYASAEFRFVR